jgi:hypothetical protein
VALALEEEPSWKALEAGPEEGGGFAVIASTHPDPDLPESRRRGTSMIRRLIIRKPGENLSLWLVLRGSFHEVPSAAPTPFAPRPTTAVSRAQSGRAVVRSLRPFAALCRCRLPPPVCPREEDQQTGTLSGTSRQTSVVQVHPRPHPRAAAGGREAHRDPERHSAKKGRSVYVVVTRGDTPSRRGSPDSHYWQLARPMLG